MKTTIGMVARVTLLFCAGAWSQAWAVATLQEVKVNPLMADQLLLELSFSEPVSGFTDRLSYEPNQLLLHVPGAVGALNVNPLPIKQQGVDNLKVEGKGAGLDIKIALDQLTPIRCISRATSCWWHWEKKQLCRCQPPLHLPSW